VAPWWTVRGVDEVTSLEGYNAVVLVRADDRRMAPRRTGLPQAPPARLSQIPVAYFITCISLTQTGERPDRGRADHGGP